MRMQSSSGRTKILPSPISPLRARAAPFDDGVDRGLDELLVDGDLQLHLAEQIDGDFVPAVDLGVPLLAAETLHVHDREAKDFDLGQGRFDGFQSAGLNDGDDELHAAYLSASRGAKSIFQS